MRRNGFSLLEMLVVVLIMAGVAAVAVPRFASAFDLLTLRSSTQDVAATLRRCRELAVNRSRVTEFTLDPGYQTYRATVLSQDVDWPDAVTIFAAGVDPNAPWTVRFYPDGSASGGHLVVQSRGRQYEILVDWLTGRVRIA